MKVAIHNTIIAFSEADSQLGRLGLYVSGWTYLICYVAVQRKEVTS